jgi:hypothetical protein
VLAASISARVATAATTVVDRRQGGLGLPREGTRTGEGEKRGTVETPVPLNGTMGEGRGKQGGWEAVTRWGGAGDGMGDRHPGWAAHGSWHRPRAEADTCGW